MQIGDRVRDTVSGFRGTIIAETTWLGGRQTFMIQAPAGPEYRPPVWIEGAMLEIDDTPEGIGFFGSTDRFTAGIKES